MNRFKSLKTLIPYFKPYRLVLILALVSAIIFIISNVSIPYIAGMITTNVVNHLSQHQAIDFSTIRHILVLFLIVGMINVIFQYASNALMTVGIQNAMTDLRTDIAKKLDRLPMSYVDNEKKGDLLSRLTNDVDVINNACQQGILNIFTAILSVTFAISMMIYLNIWLTIISMVMIPMIYFFTKWILNKSQSYFKGQQESIGQLNAFVQENLEGFDVMKLYNHETEALVEFKQINHKLEHCLFKASSISGFLMPLMNLSAYTGYLVVAFIGGIFTIQGTLLIGQLQAFIQYIWQVSQPLSQMSQLSNMFQGAVAGIDRINELMDVPDLQDIKTTASATQLKGSVVFDKVNFSYTDKPLIEDFNLTVNPGEMIAIVGPTGAGKTTLVNLLMRFYDIQSGKILLDGMDSTCVSTHDWRSHFGMVLQDAWLFEGTIMDNLKFGDLSKSNDEIIEIVKSCNIHDEIMAFPDGYNTKLEIGGAPLSQGQKQLLTIARAIIRNPEILILDEATSSVDTRLERKIQYAMDQVMENRTSFVIAHRLSTIQKANHIIVLENGKIIEKGDHQSLLKQDGAYASLYKSQFEC